MYTITMMFDADENSWNYGELHIYAEQVHDLMKAIDIQGAAVPVEFIPCVFISHFEYTPTMHGWENRSDGDKLVIANNMLSGIGDWLKKHDIVFRSIDIEYTDSNYHKRGIYFRQS